MEFIVDGGRGAQKGIIIAVGVLALVLGAALCINCLRIRKSLHDKHMDSYHKLKSKQSKKKDHSCSRKSREYKKLKKFMRNVMKS